jgi:hypothetical protein
MSYVEVMKQALEALTCIWEDGLESFPASAHERAIDTLDAAIEQAEKQEPVESRCANCGKPKSQAASCISDYPEDGEWFCSEQCYDQHGELGCPHATHDGYRHPVESAKLIECERIMRELASWLGCGGYNADEFIPSEFEAKIRHGIEHLHPPAAPVQEPVQCEPQPAVTEDGYCEWVCPTPVGYLMQCCDCGLIHEVEFRVAKYEPRPSEDFVVVDDPDLQCQLRMKRRDDISPAAQRQPLTDEQIAAAWISTPDPMALTFSNKQHVIDFVRAIEAAHGIGGKK